MKTNADFLIILFLLPVLFMFSCQDENKVHEKVKGKVSLSLLVDPSVTTESGRMMAVNTDSFRISVKNASGGEVLSYERFMDVPAEIEIDTGQYYITAESVNSTSAAFDNPHYTGTSDTFHVVPKEVIPVSLVCALNNFMVSIQYSDQVVNNFDSWETNVFNTVDTLIFSQDETKPGYFEVGPLTVRCTLNYTKSDLTQGVIIITGNISEPLPKIHYIVTIDASINGFIKPIDITVDESSDTIRIVLTNFSSVNMIEGLIGLYTFNANLLDTSPLHNDGYGEGTIIYSDQLLYHSALKLVDTSEYHMFNYFRIPNNLPVNEYAVTFWISLDSLKNNLSIFALNRTDNWMYSDFWIFITENRLAILQNLQDTRRTDYIINSTYSDEFLASAELQPGIIYFVACIYKQNALSIYVNGELYAEYANIDPHTNTSMEGEIFVGVCPSPNSPYLAYQFIGAIDDLSIFSRGINEVEIQSLYLSGLNN
ncbi:MAG TPA: DUF4493 domain-containing protein [Cyclobacteriaceae bacterium]|nr:DUF4493 domain-containing protein [Cyclobacteriaceae bacterium]